jgi:hypothetical protein
MTATMAGKEAEYSFPHRSPAAGKAIASFALSAGRPGSCSRFTPMLSPPRCDRPRRADVAGSLYRVSISILRGQASRPPAQALIG